MSAELDMIYKKNPDIVKRKIAGELILVPIKSSITEEQKIFSLNEVGEYIYDNLDGLVTLKDIVSAIVGDFEVSEEQAATDILNFIEGALQQGIIIRI